MKLTRWIARSVWMASAGCVLVLGVAGCKTQEDATAAARQMAITAETLSAYYTALDHVVANTQDAYQAQSFLQGVPPMDLTETRRQIGVREEMAMQIGEVASAFQRISGSNASDEAATAAGKLNDEIVSLRGLTKDDGETKAVTQSVQMLVSLIQQHEEVKAAKQVGPLCHALSVFFDSESGLYDSLNQTYLLTAKSVSELLVQNNEVDISPVFATSLQPFGLLPAVDSKVLAPKMQSYLKQRIADSYAVRLADSKKATAAMSGALKEMDKRVTLVTNDKPMTIRMEPLSLSTVQGWIKQIAG